MSFWIRRAQAQGDGRSRMPAAAAALALVWGAMGCGAPPPQVPVALSNAVSSSLSDIAEACGEAYQQSAPGTGQGSLAPLQRSALAAGTALVGVERRNPNWIYQGDTLQQTVALAVRTLFDCRLGRAARSIEAETH